MIGSIKWEQPLRMGWLSSLYPILLDLCSWVCAPHHLLLQGVEEGVALLLYHSDGVCCSTQGDGGVLRIALADSVNSYKETTATALDIEAYGLVVCDDNGAHS